MHLLKTVDGIEIFVDEDGKFHATIGDREVKRVKLLDLEKLICEQKNPVKAIKYNHWLIEKPLVVELVRIEKDGRYRTSLGGLLNSYELTPFDQQVYDELACIYESERELKRQWDEATGNCQSMTEKLFMAEKEGSNDSS